jgi:hypothetical protein
LLVDTLPVFEHVVLATHPKQHLIDLTREVKALEKVAPKTPEAKRGIEYIKEVLTRPITLSTLGMSVTVQVPT